MAVYRFQDGKYERLGTSMEVVDKRFAEWDRPVADFAVKYGMILLDDAEGVYELFTRDQSKTTFSQLRNYRWWFRIVDARDVADDVLIGDSLPDYLDFLDRLQPLVSRARDLAAELRGVTE